MKRVWLLGITYLLALICVSFLLVALSSSLHKPFLKEEAQRTDKIVTKFLLTGNSTNLQIFTPAERSHLEDVRRLIHITTYSILLLIGGVLLYWFNLNRAERRGIMLTPFLFLFYFTPLFTFANFTKLFELFHQLLFPQGNYSFPFSSILIQTYPEKFFTSMSILIMVILLVLSILALLGEKYSARKKLKMNSNTHLRK
ncbi:DUF1461 domain-containing protein [Candidatus Woesearchaeota archaeon]|nr:DUF1461 domain-containing protein [Candidatus Woesearchaeota archaeon]